MGVNIVGEIVQTLTSGIVDLGSGIAQGLGAMAKALFIEGAGTTESPYVLSTFGTIIVIFARCFISCKLNYSGKLLPFNSVSYYRIEQNR